MNRPIFFFLCSFFMFLFRNVKMGGVGVVTIDYTEELEGKYLDLYIQTK